MTRESRRLRHQDAWELLPWYVNGTLDSDERRAVEAHLERCPLCRSELVASQALASAVREAAEVPPAAGDRLDDLLGRLDISRKHAAVAQAVQRPPADIAGHGAGRLTSAVRWTLALQAAAILALALGLAYVLALPAALPAAPPAATSAEAAFRTLAAPQAPAAPGLTVRTVFTPTATEEELRRLLLAAGARFAGGPSPAGVYTLEIDDDEGTGTAALERLRRDPRVELAEPVVIGSSAEGVR